MQKQHANIQVNTYKPLLLLLYVFLSFFFFKQNIGPTIKWFWADYGAVVPYFASGPTFTLRNCKWISYRCTIYIWPWLWLLSCSVMSLSSVFISLQFPGPLLPPRGHRAAVFSANRKWAITVNTAELFIHKSANLNVKYSVCIKVYNNWFNLIILTSTVCVGRDL